MSVENNRPSQYFPQFEKWKKFIDSTQNKRLQGPYHQHQFWMGPLNSVELAGENQSIRQSYRDPNGKYEVDIALSDDGMHSALVLSSGLSKDVEKLMVFTRANQIEDLNTWLETQEIQIILEKKYLDDLKRHELIGDNSSSTFIVSRLSNGDIKAITLECTDRDINEKEVSGELFETICHDIGLEFKFDSAQQITSGKIGKIGFSLANARVTALNSEDIWNKLTGGAGSNPPVEVDNPFIFPVTIQTDLPVSA